MIHQGPKAILCSNHPKPITKRNGYYKEYSMIEGKVTYPDKRDKEKIIVEEYLMCPRCYQSVRITPEIRLILDTYKNGTPGEATTVRRSDITA